MRRSTRATSALAGAANQITGANLASWKQWVVGLQFGYKGFTVGGSIGYDNQGIGAQLLHRRRQRDPLRDGGYHVRNRPVADVVHVDGCGQHRTVTAPTPSSRSPRAPTPRPSTVRAVRPVRSPALPASTAPCSADRSPWRSVRKRANKFELGANYALGPGVKLTGGAYHLQRRAARRTPSRVTPGRSSWAWTCASSAGQSDKSERAGESPLFSFVGTARPAQACR